MNALWLFPLIVGAGVLQAAGNAMNGALRNALNNAWLASSVSFGLILFATVALFAIMPRPFPTAEGVSEMPWWAPLGGLTGAVAVVVGLMFVDKVGAGPFNGVLIAANICASLLIDNFGLLRMPPHALSAGRIVGGLLMAGGAACIALF
ncbi:DMT family transporter [Rhizosaccharibacter radicis]|uniref:DMT family transporter n=1 Tax=Rhizosaccharibacter radicis TaxID=2782605 RepID=A0ABT1W0R8_9PROT|nr:DMT family transporter [Acetobacteraceae bacterium KSS12]